MQNKITGVNANEKEADRQKGNYKSMLKLCVYDASGVFDREEFFETKRRNKNDKNKF